MYFNNDKQNTNIDNEFANINNNQNNSSFNNKNNLSSILNKYKLIIIGAIIILILIIIFLINGKEKIYIVLEGEETISIYQGNDYIEPGYKAYNSKDEDLTNEVTIKSTLNINEIGEYEIEYSLEDATKIRKVNVIQKPKEYTYIYLTPINNSINVYLKVGEKYNEPGYQVFSSTGKDLTDSVQVTGTVDTSKKGNYKLTYSVTDTNGVVISMTRTVIVMDSEINLSLNPSAYTNGKVTINVGIIDNYFEYMILPNGNKVTSKTYSYSVSSNGKYTFTVYNKKGTSKTSSIEVKNIDKTVPNGTCEINSNGTGSTISISASDASGIKKYTYNGKTYTSNKINLSTKINTATITIYDKAGNTKNITCKLNNNVTTKPETKPNTTPNTSSNLTISNISKNGVIVTVKAKKANSNITGYYFSYTSERPSKDRGYIATSKESIDVVRLPGTTYVWVEDQNGKISSPKSITLDNTVLFKTLGTEYTILEETKLSTFLSDKGWSIDELNKLIARSVRAAGLYTKEAAATSAVSLQTVLAQKYKIKLPYYWGGKHYSIGAKNNWGGKVDPSIHSNSGTKYYYSGLDCTGFVNWAYINAGYNITASTAPSYNGMEKVSLSKENGEIGDFLDHPDHIKLIIGKTDYGFITAEAKGKLEGMVINVHPYNSGNGYRIIKSEKLTKKYSKINEKSYPKGF